MLDEMLTFLAPAPGKTVVDATLGMGSYSEAILQRMRGEGLVIGIDQDRTAVEAASSRLAGWGAAFRGVKANFSELPAVLKEEGLGKIDGLVADLGISSVQLDDPDRGFSFLADGRLDMRLDTENPVSAAEVVNRESQRSLEVILSTLGEERFARRISREIVSSRRRKPLRSTFDLADAVDRAVPGGRGRIHKSTRTFLALRSYVNAETEHLEKLCELAPEILAPMGTFVCVSFQSLEDRVVKRCLRRKHESQVWEILTPKPLTPSTREIASNPRARSAKLRAANRK